METEILLPEGWFVEGDYKTTLENMIRHFDKDFVENCDNADKFANSLFREVLFLAPYSNKEEPKVQKYIFENALALFEYAKGVVKNR